MTTVNSDLSSVSAGMTLIDPDKSTCVGSLKLAIYVCMYHKMTQEHTYMHIRMYVHTKYMHTYVLIQATLNANLLVSFKVFQLLKQALSK